MIYAEVIGDPIRHSKSPLIHKHWLGQIGLPAEFLRTKVEAGNVGSFLERRRSDANWRGCNVTIPHKEKIVSSLDELDASAAGVGAVNCVVPLGGKLVGFNTDLDGIGAALDGTELRGRTTILIGAGGAARAAVAFLASREVAAITVLVRDPNKAEALRDLAPDVDFEFALFDGLRQAAEPAAIINASPLGMIGSPEMPPSVLALVAARGSGSVVVDMVYNPLETPFLAAGRAAGGRVVDGLTMLVGQAAKAFELFFARPAPRPDRRLRDLLTT